MKFNAKIKLKTKGKTVILILIIAMSVAGISNINVNSSQVNKADEEIKPSTPPVKKYKYDYENNFDYSSHSAAVILGDMSPVVTSAVAGADTEWSQNPNDNNKLEFDMVGVFNSWEGDFAVVGAVQVESVNTFKPQANPYLGAYIDWSFDLNLDVLEGIDILTRQCYISLMILTPDPTENEELITIENFNPQKGTYYLANFKKYIWDDGKVRFALACLLLGTTLWYAPLPWFLATLDFNGLRVVQEIKPVETEREEKTLILVHGCFEADPITYWSSYRAMLEFQQSYDKIIIMSYYGNYRAHRYSKDEDGVWHDDPIFFVDFGLTPQPIFTLANSIVEIAFGLALYIMQDLFYVGNNVDIVSHSMGGLVTRFMVKHFYEEIKNFYALFDQSFTINSVCTCGTPNHGLMLGWIAWAFPFPIIPPLQIAEMGPGSLFLTELNYIGVISGTEIPLSGIFINWFTYRGGDHTTWLSHFIRGDGLVGALSVPIAGATNRGIFNVDHGGTAISKMTRHVIFNDLVEPPDIIEEIFATGIPGTIICIEDLTLEPNFEMPGGKTLLSITLDPQDVNDIEPTSMEVDINPIFPMQLKSGTEGTYEVELPLEDGDYSFLITADEHDGGTYQIYGNLRIVDDDAQAPQIFISPLQTLISDEEAEGGVSVLWVISDYSGIDEAIVTLNELEIASYSDEGEIIGGYLIPNTLGVYTFSFYARDDDNDPGHDPPGGDWLEGSIERTFTIYDDDIDPPVITITPGDGYFSDGETVGGLLVSWDISDYSGISEATVELNGDEIRSYGLTEGSIEDSYLLLNEPGTYTFEIWAKDGDNDLRHDPLEQDWLDNSAQRTIVIYDDDTTGPTIYPLIIDRYWVGDQLCLEFNVFATDHQSGIGIVDIKIGSYSANFLGRHYAVLDPGNYDLQITVSNGDNDRLFDTEISYLTIPIDLMPLVTTISFGTPHHLIGDNHHITSDTEIIFTVDAVSELDETLYKISNDQYPGEWTQYTVPLFLNLDDGIYTLEYYSIDTEGNTEKIKSVSIVLDNSAPFINIITPQPGVALQDGVTFTMEVTDLTGVEWVSISIREPDGSTGIIIDPAFEDLSAINVGGDIWQYDFDTTLLPDGYYILFVETIDPLGQYGYETVNFAIRNWAVLELLPATEKNRAGRTMPVKFSLRVVEAVDPAMPFVWNEELDILIYDESDPSTILQHSTYGDTSVDYRISAEGELYITNFKTSKTPAVYIVEIWRKGIPIGTFDFETYLK
ncbi:MAG: hypothetical protein ACFFA3_15620 [Promethearchaeota archaeon]